MLMKKKGNLTTVAVGVWKMGEANDATIGMRYPNTFMGTGRLLSVVAGRLSYVFGLQVLL
jgi:hypothetical protein